MDDTKTDRVTPGWADGPPELELSLELDGA